MLVSYLSVLYNSSWSASSLHSLAVRPVILRPGSVGGKGQSSGPKEREDNGSKVGVSRELNTWHG